MRQYYFLCACGCGTKSANLGKNYFRLQKGQAWYSKDCVPVDSKIIKDVVEGKIVEKEDF